MKKLYNFSIYGVLVIVGVVYTPLIVNAQLYTCKTGDSMKVWHYMNSPSDNLTIDLQTFKGTSGTIQDFFFPSCEGNHYISDTDNEASVLIFHDSRGMQSFKDWIRSDEFVGDMETLWIRFFSFIIHFIAIYVGVKIGLLTTKPRKKGDVQNT